MGKSYKDLIVWQKSYELCLLIYETTKSYPKCEQYGLINQLRRCAVSIPSNISEGYNRTHKGEYLQFLSIAYGSVAELETQLLISKDLGYCNKERFEKIQSLLIEVSKMLRSLMEAIRNG
jgi:four helix bundle protein